LRELIIDGVRIADDTDCYVIAEIGHNHQGNFELCCEMFKAAKLAGCNAVKLQKRHNKTLYSEEMYNAPYNSENAFGATYGEHREALEFNLEEYDALKCYAKHIGITFFATAFDIPSLEFLVELGVPAIKIASGDLSNTALLRKAWPLRLPTILSTGGSGLDGIRDAIHCFDHANNPAILHCTSGYPAKYEELNLRCIETLRQRFRHYVIGWSGHDTGTAMAPVAYALGARIIEKHFTLDRTMKGTDQPMSLEPQGMRHMIESLKQCRLALGDGIKRQYDSEKEPLKKQRKNAQGQIDGKTEIPLG
jgi:sialic acid synthase